MSLLKVLHVGPLPPPMGGVAAALQMILNCPTLQNIDQDVFNTSPGQRTETVGRKNLTLGRSWRRLKLLVGTAYSVLRTKPDIVHFQCGSESTLNMIGDLMVMGTGRLIRSKVILHLHVDPAQADLPNKKPFNQWLFRQLTRPAQAIFTLTETYRNHLLSCMIQQPIYVVPNMCDETLLNLSVSRSRKQGEIHVIFLGRLTEAKGVFDLLQEAAQLRPHHPQIRFDIAGLPSTPEEKILIDKFLEQENLQATVNLLGLVTDQDKIKLFQQADILITPSYGESFGITAIEAMAAGLPVLATRVGGLQSIVVEGKTGYLVEPGNVAEMEDYLLKLAGNDILRLEMGQAGRARFINHYSKERIGTIIAEAYHHLLQ